MSGDIVGADPELLRALGRRAAALGQTAESVRDAALVIADAGALDGAVGAPLATLADEALLLASAADERADALEAAGASGLVLEPAVVAGPGLAAAGGPTALDALTVALDDGTGSTGMTAALAIETLRLQRAALDTDGDGAIEEAELAAVAASSDLSVRAAAAFLRGRPDASAAVATAGGGGSGGFPPFPPPAMPIDAQLAAVNELAPAELGSVITGWAVAAGHGLGGAHTVRVRRREVSTTDVVDELIVDGPVTESLVVRPVAVPDLDDDWLAALADLAPAGTAAMVLVYRREEVHGEYTVDPVPPLPEPVGNIAWAGGTALAGAAALGSGAAAALNPIGVGAGLAVGLYSFVDWLAPDDERRRDTSAIFDVEYRDARGTVLDIGRNMAVLRHEVSGPLFGGPAVIVLPCTPPDDD